MQHGVTRRVYGRAGRRAEYRLLERFRESTRGRTALVISRRFSIVRQADYIVALDGGRVVEQGSHHQLLRRADRYAELFEMQACHYS